METTPAPYAPPAAVLSVIRFYRKRDVPEKITTGNLLQIGVTESLLRRTVAALRFLDLIQEDWTTTDQLRAVRFASDEQYQEVLGGILTAAYKRVLDALDLATAGEREIQNAFIPYSPAGQRGRMITLFLELAKEAGWSAAIEAKASASRPIARKPRIGQPKTRDKQRESEVQQNPPPSQEGVIAFGVTDADLAALPDGEFDDVWASLGKLARARAKARREPDLGGDEARKE